VQHQLPISFIVVYQFYASVTQIYGSVTPRQEDIAETVVSAEFRLLLLKDILWGTKWILSCLKL